MFEMNWTEANAASRLCAANANDTKFKALPRMKQDIPPVHIRLPGYAHHCCGYLQDVGRGGLVVSAFATGGGQRILGLPYMLQTGHRPPACYNSLSGILNAPARRDSL